MIIFLNFINLPYSNNWFSNYFQNNLVWFSSSLNWESNSSTFTNEYFFIYYLINGLFNNIYYFIDFNSKLSFLEILILRQIELQFFKIDELKLFFFFDNISFSNSIYNIFQFFFNSDNQNFWIILLYYTPELTFGMIDFIKIFFLNNSFNLSINTEYDLYNDNLNITNSEFLESLIYFFFFSWLFILIINFFRIQKIFKKNNFLLIKNYFFLYNTSKDSRIQFEMMIEIFFFFFFFWTMLIVTFDDDQEEFIDIFNTSCFIFFLLIIFYLLQKYSQHYFAFLEPSVSDNRSASFALKQFSRDFINTFALILRFFILIFRINVYDTLDDLYDSYYIYFGDFDDDEYYDELIFPITSLLFFDYDVNDDRIYSLEEENDFFFDFFFLYYLCWSKFFLFIFFAIEEILRLLLAFYIFYLIIFEVHSVNCSYSEDFFFLKKKNIYKQKKINLL